MKQFSPEQRRAALAKQQAAYQQNQPSRAIGSILAGSSGSEAVMNKNKADWEGIDAQNMLQSLGAQEKLQSQATAGISAAKNVQDMAKVAGEYSGNQIEKQQKLQTSQLTLDQQKRLNSAGSTETILAKRMLLSQLQSDPRLAADPELKAVLARPDVTAQMIMGFMDKNVLDAYKKQVGIVTDETKAAGDQAVAKDMFGATKPVIGSPQPTPSAPPAKPYVGNAGRGKGGNYGPLGWNGNPNDLNDTSPITNSDRVNILRAELAKATTPEDKASIEREIARAGGSVSATPTSGTPTLSADAKERMKYSTITGGGQTLQPNPVDVKKAEGSGKEAASFSERVATYKTYVEPAIDETLKFLETTDAGKGTRAFAKYWPGNEQQKLMTLLARVNQMNPGVMPDNISKAIQAGQTGEGFNGKILESLTNEQIRGFLSMAKKNMLNEIDYNNKRSAAEKTTGSGNYAGTQGVTPNPKPASSAKGTVEMTKGGKTYNIPAADAAEAESMGYKRK